MTVAEGGGIFVSYRRQESSHLAGRLADRLADRFGEGQVFIDVDTIEPGVDFAEEISRAVATPDAGGEWTDDGSVRETRQLKHRAEGDSRVVPTHPELTRLLRDHLANFATAS